MRRSVRIEDGGIPTVKISDYDNLCNHKRQSTDKKAERLFSITLKIYSFPENALTRDTPVQFINDDIKLLNKYLEEGRYFYTQIKQEGIVLYNSGKYKLARRRKLNYAEIKEQAQEYFDEKFQSANEFLHTAKLIYKEEYYKMESFLLHQACENYYYAIRLTFTLRNNKQHNLSKLSSATKRYSEDLATVFPQDTLEEKRLFTLLKSAYVEARYNPYFVVTKEDIDALVPKVELLRDITKLICTTKIKEYEEQSNTQ